MCRGSLVVTGSRSCCLWLQSFSSISTRTPHHQSPSWGRKIVPLRPVLNSSYTHCEIVIFFMLWLGLVYSSRRSAHCPIFLNTGRTNEGRRKNLICPFQDQLIWGWWRTRRHLFYQVSRTEHRGCCVADRPSVQRSEASGRVGPVASIINQSLSFYLMTQWVILISAFELFLTALVKEEMSRMPRGVHFMAMRGGSLASARGKTVAGIPAFMLKTYEKNKQPGLKSGLTGDALASSSGCFLSEPSW